MSATEYEGLWAQERSGWYRSRTFSFSSFKQLFGMTHGRKKKFCVVLRQNKYWKSNEGTAPRFIFSIMDKSSSDCKVYDLKDDPEYMDCFLKSLDDDEIAEVADTLGLYTHDQVQYAVRRAAEDGQNGYTDVIVEDYI